MQTKTASLRLPGLKKYNNGEKEMKQGSGKQTICIDKVTENSP